MAQMNCVYDINVYCVELSMGNSHPAKMKRILIAEDDITTATIYRRVLSNAGYDVDVVANGYAAEECLKIRTYEVIVSDIAMPGMNGIDLLRAVRSYDLEVPVIIVTGSPAVESAMRAVEYGAINYLIKPVEFDVLTEAVKRASRIHRIALIKREAMEYLGTSFAPAGDRAGLEVCLDHAVATLTMRYQPIISRSQKRVIGYEALMRTEEPLLPEPKSVLAAAVRLGRIGIVAGRVRESVAAAAASIPQQSLIFVNIHPDEFLDESLYSHDTFFSAISSRVVLEITEYASLEDIPEIRARLAALRRLGFRIALDDLGTGCSGLSNFVLVEPDFVKIDMTLIRNIDLEPVKQRITASIVELCREIGISVICEGVETRGEYDTLAALGCDLLQGFFISHPSHDLPDGDEFLNI